MKYLTHTLSLVVVLVLGFFVGARYQGVMDNVVGLKTLVEVQNRKLSELRESNSHLTTVARLREILSDNRIRLSRSNVEEMATRVDRVSKKYGVSPDMIFAVIQAESSFDPLAVSERGAMGLMQLLPSTARELAEDLNIRWTDERILWDPLTNIEMGTYYLGTLLSRFNDVQVALAAYNQGPNRIAGIKAANASLPLDYSERVLSVLESRN